LRVTPHARAQAPAKSLLLLLLTAATLGLAACNDEGGDTRGGSSTARVVRGDQERVMLSPQMDGDCNSCHTENGANGAPGRIVAP